MAYPGQMERARVVRLSKNLFPQIAEGQIYADWTGAALPPVSIIREYGAHLSTTLLGNPHSGHAPSRAAAAEMTVSREALLRFLNAPPDEYEVIFTSGATAAIRLLEHYRFNGGQLLLTADNHNSINGLRETARQAGAIVIYAAVRFSQRIKDLVSDFNHAGGRKWSLVPQDVRNRSAFQVFHDQEKLAA